MVRHIPSTTADIASLLSAIYAATGEHDVPKAVIGDVSQGKVPDLKGHTGKESNREYLLQLYKRNGDTGVVPEVLQALENRDSLM